MLPHFKYDLYKTVRDVTLFIRYMHALPVVLGLAFLITFSTYEQCCYSDRSDVLPEMQSIPVVVDFVVTGPNIKQNNVRRKTHPTSNYANEYP